VLRKFICISFLLIDLVTFPLWAHAQTATVTTVYNFTGQSDGAIPETSLIQGNDGAMYGATSVGDTLYRVTAAGDLTTLYTFPAAAADGALIQASDGNFYGVTSGGGNSSQCVLPNGCGTIFQLTPSGNLTTLYSFSGLSDGGAPEASLIQGSDGNLYGTTDFGGDTASCVNGQLAGCGSIFRFSKSGKLTTLHAFQPTDGSYIASPLLQASDGNFYGTASSGGLMGSCPDQNYSGCGTIFRITPAGTFTVIHAFTETDGWRPMAGLTQGSDGSLYGTTVLGGSANNDICVNSTANGCGTIFKITTAGNFTSVYSFTASDDGRFPEAPLFAGGDGNLYGTAANAGANQFGTIFQVTPSGAFNALYSFSGGNADPFAGLLQGNDGNFYGTTADGGLNYGTVYSLELSSHPSPPVQVTLSASTVNIGSSVTLTWTVSNAASTTLQQCYAFVHATLGNPADAGNWSGLQTGTVTNGIVTGSAIITPTAAGIYTYALTCGGIESGLATINAGNAKAATTTGLQTNSPVTLGGVLTLTAFTNPQQNLGPLTGSVTFSHGSLTLGTLELSNGSASLNLEANNIPTGSYRILATYSGDANYLPSSATSTVVVASPTYQTTTTLSVSPTTLAQGQTANMMATVAVVGSGDSPSGKVTFHAGNSVLGTATLSAGIATFSAKVSGAIPPGIYAVTAMYDGDPPNLTSTSAPVTVTVIAATTTSLAVSPNPVPPDHAVTLTSRVVETYGSAVPTGMMSFSVGNYFVGSQRLDGTGAATLNLSDVGIAAGIYPLTASYSGDALNAASSSTVSVTIQ